MSLMGYNQQRVKLGTSKSNRGKFKQFRVFALQKQIYTVVLTIVNIVDILYEICIVSSYLHIS